MNETTLLSTRVWQKELSVEERKLKLKMEIFPKIIFNEKVFRLFTLLLREILWHFERVC